MQLLCLTDPELYFAITIDKTRLKERSIRDALLIRMLVTEKEAISLEKIKCWICSVIFEVYNYMLSIEAPSLKLFRKNNPFYSI